nr:hypothetical protein [Tanacetum cinerariifolium]
MSRDVLTGGSTMMILLLYRGECSQWVERFMNYLEEQTDGEAMINSIKNGDQPLPRVTQVSIAGTSSTEQPPLKDKSMWSDQEKRIQKIDRLERSLLIQGLPNDIYSLIDSNKTAKDLWDALTRHMFGSEYGEQDRKATVLYEYETFKATEGELLLDTYIRYLQVINDLKKCGYSKDNWEIHRNHHKSKMDFASNKPLYLLHMDLCGASEVIISFIKKTQVNLQLQVQRVRTDNGTEFKNKTLAKFFDEVGITQQFFAARTPQQNGVVEKRNRTLVEAARTMLTFANLPSFLWAEAIATACFIHNRSVIHKHLDKTPYELINKRKPNIKFFRVFGCRCYLLNDYEDDGKLKAKGDIRVFVGYSKQSAAFRIYNKRTRKIHESVNVNFDEILEMASKQFSLEPSLSNLNKTGKSSNLSVSKVFETSKKDLEDLFQYFYDEYFNSSKIMKSITTNVETSINEEAFHEASESFQGESSLSSLNDNVQQSPEEVILPSSNTQSIPINMIPIVDEASTSHNVFNERLEDAYFDASTSFPDPSNVHTYYQPYPHEKKWTKDHPLYKIIGDPKSSVRTRGQLANSCLFSCLPSSIEPANVAEALRDADWVSSMQEELDQFARLKVWRLVPRPEGKSIIKTKWIFKNKKVESSLVIRNKARLVAVGYSQQEGIYYDETFAPVA